MPHRLNPNDPRPNSIGGFQLPRFNSGLGRALTTGRGVSVYYDQQPPNVWPEHSHGSVQILIAIDSVDAVLSWKFNGEQSRHGVTGQFVWLLPAGVLHAAEWLGQAGMVVLYVETSFVKEVYGADMNRPLVEDFSALARFDLLVCRLTGEFRSLCSRRSSATPAIIESAGTLLATQILRYFIPPERPFRLPADRLREIMDYIDAHIGEDITREQLAQLVGMSVRTFGECFKERTGMTPVDYIMQRRTVLAMQLVDQGLLTKTAIAADLGFSDQSHMMRRIDALRKTEEDAAKTEGENGA
jgi:AraC family transcriptional regulator